MPKLRQARSGSERQTLQNAVTAADQQIDALVYELFNFSLSTLRSPDGIVKGSSPEFGIVGTRNHSVMVKGPVPHNLPTNPPLVFPMMPLLAVLELFLIGQLERGRAFRHRWSSFRRRRRAMVDKMVLEQLPPRSLFWLAVSRLGESNGVFLFLLFQIDRRTA